MSVKYAAYFAHTNENSVAIIGLGIFILKKWLFFISERQK